MQGTSRARAVLVGDGRKCAPLRPAGAGRSPRPQGPPEILKVHVRKCSLSAISITSRLRVDDGLHRANSSAAADRSWGNGEVGLWSYHTAFLETQGSDADLRPCGPSPRKSLHRSLIYVKAQLV